MSRGNETTGGHYDSRESNGPELSSARPELASGDRIWLAFDAARHPNTGVKEFTVAKSRLLGLNYDHRFELAEEAGDDPHAVYDEEEGLLWFIESESGDGRGPRTNTYRVALLEHEPADEEE